MHDMIAFPYLSKLHFNNRLIASIYLVAFCVQIVPIEGEGISSIKVMLMACAPLLFLFKTFYITKPFIWGIFYWLVCFICASFQDYMRFSTIGYLGMFLITYIVFYNLIYQKAFTLKFFFHLVRGLIIAYGTVLILQQIAMIVGIHSFWPINLVNQPFLTLTKLPSLSLEPSHSARLLTVIMLAYLRCVEIAQGGVQPNIKSLFHKEHRVVSLLFLWSMCTMGSGTAFIGIGILSIYFIRRQTFVYIVPLLLLTFFISRQFEIEQLDRAVRVTQATMTGDVTNVQEADGSAAVRIIPIINTFTKTDLTDKETWFGKGTTTDEEKEIWWTKTDQKLGVIEQYGLIAFILSLILVYTCMIHRIFSIESLCFLLLLGMSVGNIAYGWGMMMLFTVISYFQKMYALKPLIHNS